MSYFLRALKAKSLKKKLALYEEEKVYALFPSSRPERKRKKQAKKKSGIFGKCIKTLTDENTYVGFVWRSFVRFSSGVILTYIFFLFFVVGINLPLFSAFYMCAVMGVIFSIGLAFSKKVRCYVLLLLPIFFSKQGRRVLMAYAFLLALTGPARNTLRNMGILSDSLSCGQDQLRQAVRQIVEMVKAPFKSIKELITKVTKAINSAVESVKASIANIKRVIVAVLNVIKAASSWLGSIVGFCNKKLGTPFDRCMRIFDDAVEDCKAKMGIMRFMCNVVNVVKGLCYTVKWLDFLCMFVDFVSDKIMNAAKKKLREFSLHMKNIFYVSVEFSRYSDFTGEASKSVSDIGRGIFKEVRQRASRFHAILNGLSFLFGLLFLVLFVKVLYYKHKYFSSDSYDNRYINKYIAEIDIRRIKINKETVLPLEPREKKHFSTATSIWLLDVEKRMITKSFFFLTLTTFKIACVLFCDYFLYWLLLLIRRGGQKRLPKVTLRETGLHVEGHGVLANLYRKIAKAFKIPDDPGMNLDPIRCLPDPIQPDIPRYCQIGFLTIICWLLTFTEPYGLRMRHVVMAHYYPDRAKERAVHLYNHILRSRGGFLKFARRQLRRTYQKNGVEKITIMQRLFALCPLLRVILGQKSENMCLLCGTPETDEAPLKTCKTPDCVGKYCSSCYSTLQNICTICQNPLEYGDLSDVSEERDSSDFDAYAQQGESEADDPDDPDDTDDTDDSSDGEEQTFKEIESREKFRDVESNPVRDSVSLLDLQQAPSEESDFMDADDLKELLKHHLKFKLQEMDNDEDDQNATTTSNDDLQPEAGKRKWWFYHRPAKSNPVAYTATVDTLLNAQIRLKNFLKKTKNEDRKFLKDNAVENQNLLSEVSSSSLDMSDVESRSEGDFEPDEEPSSSCSFAQFSKKDDSQGNSETNFLDFDSEPLEFENSKEESPKREPENVNFHVENETVKNEARRRKNLFMMQ